MGGFEASPCFWQWNISSGLCVWGPPVLLPVGSVAYIFGTSQIQPFRTPGPTVAEVGAIPLLSGMLESDQE